MHLHTIQTLEYKPRKLNKLRNLKHENYSYHLIWESHCVLRIRFLDRETHSQDVRDFLCRLLRTASLMESFWYQLTGVHCSVVSSGGLRLEDNFSNLYRLPLVIISMKSEARQFAVDWGSMNQRNCIPKTVILVNVPVRSISSDSSCRLLGTNSDAGQCGKLVAVLIQSHEAETDMRWLGSVTPTRSMRELGIYRNSFHYFLPKLFPP